MFGLRPIVVLAVVLHAIGIARTELPAQDGLKFIRVAKAFQDSPPWEAVRGSDQHPLYPAAIAGAQPIVALFVGDSPSSWRVAAGLVSAVASVLLLFPLYVLIRTLFDERVATLGAFLWCVLPLPGQVGHDTLSDPLALLFFVGTLALGARIGEADGRGSARALACGACAGLGFLARPEVLLAPVAVVAGRLAPGGPRVAFRHLAPTGVACLAIVGGYTLVKGQVSEKLAIRRMVPGLAPASVAAPAQARAVARPSATDRDIDLWSFEPKEESARQEATGPAGAAWKVVRAWGDGLCWVLVPFAGLGLLVGRRAEGSDGLRRSLIAFALVFGPILARHAAVAGYLSDRHGLALMLVALPFAAAGVVEAWRWLLGRRPAFARLGRWPAIGAAIALTAVAVGVQAKPMHPSRWGHREAGRLLARLARGDEAVLDTRGWAAFLSGVRSYDPWHTRQAFRDEDLTYLIVGDDEIKAESRRGEAIRRILAAAGEPVAGFPLREGDEQVGVWIYRVRPDRGGEARP